MVVSSNGIVWHDLLYRPDAVRPTLFLKSSVTLKSGTGTSDNPYKI